MIITTTKLTDIKSNPNNPRIIKDDKFKKLVASIKEFPQMLSLRPIVVNDDMIVLGGNMRLKACKEAGLKEVPIIKASDLNEDQQKAFIIKDNVGYGEWDWDMLANEWDAEELVEWGLDVPVFDVDDLGTADEKDLSDKIQSQFRIEVICIDEESQEKTYNNLIEQGYECRLLTL
jgi:ParB-like chromosome segregation protein Spo0J